MNPYESTNAKSMNGTRTWSRNVGKFGIYIIQSLMIIALAARLPYAADPWIRNWARPRFGSVGLSVCGNLVILLMLRKPTRVAFVLSALMFFAIGIPNAHTLLLMGTFSAVTNQFTDRFHSSWLWCVVPCLIAGAYVAWLSACTTPIAETKT